MIPVPSTFSSTVVSVILAILCITAGCTSASFPANAQSIDQEDAMVIEGVIQGNNLAAIEKALLDKKEGKVDLVINSPGGSVGTGFRFVSVMEDAKSRGLRLKCYVGTMAASMAFQILLHCNERYVLDRSLLLWHRARIMMGGFGGSPMTAPQLEVLSSSLARMDEVIFSEVKSSIYMDETALRYHFENETMHIGSQLSDQTGSFISSPAIPGLYEALNNKKLPRSAAEELIFRIGGETEPPPRVPLRNDLSGFEFGEIIYIK